MLGGRVEERGKICATPEVDSAPEAYQLKRALLRVRRRLSVGDNYSTVRSVVVLRCDDFVDALSTDRAMILPFRLEHPQLTVDFSKDVSTVVAAAIDVRHVPKAELAQESLDLAREAVRTTRTQGGRRQVRDGHGCACSSVPDASSSSMIRQESRPR